MPNTHIESTTHSLLLTTWFLACDRAAGDRFPVGDKPMTNRRPRNYRRSNGTYFDLSATHHSVWHALVIHAQDISVTPTHTMRGRERLAQTAGINVGVLDCILRDLEFAGMILRCKRKGMQSNMIHLFLEPYSPTVAPNLTPREIECGMEPPYVAHQGKSIYAVSRELDPETAQLVDYITSVFKDHPCAQDAKGCFQLGKDLQRSIKVAGSPQNVAKIVYALSHDPLPSARKSIQAVMGAKHLGTYLNACMSGWLKTYPEAIPADAPPPVSTPNASMPDLL